MESIPVLDMKKGQLYYRPLRPGDFAELKAAHLDLFPIDYDDGFFSKAVNGMARIFSLAAFDITGGCEKLVGFVTARLVPMSEVEKTDRQHMGVFASSWNSVSAVYILTLGVVPGYQKQGIATTLIGQLEQHSANLGARVMFFHVITYNEPAVRLYTRCHFRCVANLRNFYCIKSGRQPDPRRTRWDGFLFMKWVPMELKVSTGPVMEAIAPIRNAWGTCWPFACRQLFVSPGPPPESSIEPQLQLSQTTTSIFRRLFGRGRA
ncbi:hypothetical protein BSKO_10030 [Bryopsis sp. KO-2023]|nr:hypothetical protein BSKO_10030 [Bryopsis sp. KO-2023]